MKKKNLQPLVSVVICTRNRKLDVVKTVDSIQHGSYPYVEIIVVDNNDIKLAELKRVCAKRKLVYTFGESTDLSTGRNVGIRKAKGSIVAFTDDDCVADPGWIAEIVANMTKEYPVITGRVISNKSGLSDNGPEVKKWMRVGWQGYMPWLMGHGANMAFAREVIKKVGNFDTDLGPGSKGLNGDDGDYLLRCLEHNFGIVYQPTAKVIHIDKSHDQLLKDAYAYQFGHRRILKKHVSTRSILLQVGSVVYLLFVMGMSLGRDTFTYKMSWNKLRGFVSG